MNYRFLLTLLWLSSSAQAATYALPPPDVDVVGEVQFTRARQEDTLSDIARRYGLGFNEIVNANPEVDRWLPGEGTLVVLPTRYVLPKAPRRGIVVNLSEMRLYFYPEAAPNQSPVVITHPISVGRMDWNTPLGVTQVARKKQDPTWYPPQSIKDRYRREEGKILPDVFPPGPDNPLGRHALYLGLPSYLIHGVNQAKEIGIGMRVTHGCIRMYPEDIARLYDLVPVGTPVNLVDQPVKAGWLAGSLFVEIHAPLADEELPQDKPTREAVLAVVQAKAAEQQAEISADMLATVLDQSTGVAVPVWPTVVGESRLARRPPPVTPAARSTTAPPVTLRSAAQAAPPTQPPFQAGPPTQPTFQAAPRPPAASTSP